MNHKQCRRYRLPKHNPWST